MVRTWFRTRGTGCLLGRLSAVHPFGLISRCVVGTHWRAPDVNDERTVPLTKDYGTYFSTWGVYKTDEERGSNKRRG